MGSTQLLPAMGPFFVLLAVSWQLPSAPKTALCSFLHVPPSIAASTWQLTSSSQQGRRDSSKRGATIFCASCPLRHIPLARSTSQVTATLKQRRSSGVTTITCSSGSQTETTTRSLTTQIQNLVLHLLDWDTVPSSLGRLMINQVWMLL